VFQEQVGKLVALSRIGQQVAQFPDQIRKDI
jgi:hypothetical protein